MNIAAQCLVEGTLLTMCLICAIVWTGRQGSAETADSERKGFFQGDGRG